MEHYKSRNNDYYHFTNPHDNITELLDDDEYDFDFDFDYDHQSQSYDDHDNCSCDFNFHPISINQSSPTANSQVCITPIYVYHVLISLYKPISFKMSQP